MKLLNNVFPGFDIRSVGGFLQLLFVEFGLILAGLAAATLVAVWASDETSGRLEFLLATPLSRIRWVTSGGVAILVGIVVVTIVAALGIAIGAVIAGGDIVQPVVGSLVLGLYAAALAGIGVAIGGLFRTSWAAPAVALFTIVTWLIDILGPRLQAPGRRSPAGADVPLRLHDAGPVGPGRDRGVGRARGRRHPASARGASSGAT